MTEIKSSINYAKQYNDEAEKTFVLTETAIHLSECPFCKQKNEELLREGNLLNQAIGWLNEELSKTPYLLESFLSEEKSIELEINKFNEEIGENYKKIKTIELTINELEKNKSLEEQGLKVKLKIENILEEAIEYNYNDINKKIEEIHWKIKEIKGELKKYNTEKKIKDAETYINDEMAKIGVKFNFEETYNPINLKFSLETFDLWHEKENGNKVFLRSMGSGANWLYCHLTLFASIHKYFCQLGESCLIPPILFIDQPSQVYFPTSIDVKEKFNAKELKNKEGKISEVDEDLKAVTNFYNQLVKFCKTTLLERGIEPQIIITDHADRLELEDVKFETLVNGRRWRKRGFIAK